MKFRTDIEIKFRQNLDVPKKNCFQIIFRKKLDIIQMDLDMDCPKNLDKIQIKFREPIKYLDKFSMCSKFF